MSVSCTSARIRFGPYELDPRSGELSKFGRKLRLQEQPFQILVLLLDRPGEVVTREHIQKKLWSDDTFVDFDHGLNNAVKRLRETLCDSAEKPRYIETLPRRGYRFVAQVEFPEVSEPLAPAVTVSEPRAISGRKRLALLVLLALVIIATVGIGDSSTPPHPAIRVIAVLPLDNLSGDPSQDYFAAGLTDALTTELARVGSLSVVSRTSAVKYKGKTMAEIARDLKVDAVIEGSVGISANRIRINPQLIDAHRDRQLWAENYDRDIGDALKLQTEIAVTIARRVQATLSPGAGDRVTRPQVDPRAFDLYLRAVPRLGSNNLQDNDAAIALLEKAVAIDPNFALAYAQLAMEYRSRSTQFRLWREPANENSSIAIQHALSLDPDLPETYLARAFVTWSKLNNWPHEAAIIDLKHSLALNPNLAEAHHQLANVYNHIGLLEVAQQHIERAESLDPTKVGIRFRVGINLLYQGRWEDALQDLRSAKEFFPSLWAYQSAFALLQMGRLDEAQELIQNATPDDSPETAGLLEAMDAVLAAKAGDVDRANRQIHAAVARGEQFQHFHHVAYAIASAYAVMNRRQEALSWLRRAADDGFPCYPLFEHDHNLDGLRADPGFVQFMADLKQTWEHYKAIS